MTSVPANARTLLNRIFAAWCEDCLPGYPEDTAFEIFASELVLWPYDLALDDVETGIVGDGQDGGIDSVYVFYDDNLIDEDSEVVDPSSKPADFSQKRSYRRVRGHSQSLGPSGLGRPVPYAG